MIVPLLCNSVKTLTSHSQIMSSRFLHTTNSSWSKLLLSRLKQGTHFGKDLQKVVKIPSRQGGPYVCPPMGYTRIPWSKEKKIGVWFLCCSGMVVGSVILGGITRLTKSGLSMVDWHLFKEFPPLTKKSWNLEFEKYKQYPEYKQNNRDMTLEEFKKIWLMEFYHRMWGRAVGVAFLVPAVLFWRNRMFNNTQKATVMGLGALILGQGLLGWYMVKSGLKEKPDSNEIARVSQYRLAAHLGMAFVIYSIMVSAGLDCLLKPREIKCSEKMSNFKRFARGTKGLIFLTAFSGAFVAGIEAGLIYNTWPKMADRWVPTDLDALDPLWKNVTENPAMTQFNHRALGETVFCVVTGLWLYSRRLPLPYRARLATNYLFSLACLQVSLGILTLLFQVPKPLAACHQSGSVALFTSALWLTHELKLLQRMPRI